MSTSEQLAEEHADLTVMAEVEAEECRWCGEVEPAATMQPMQVGGQQGPVCETCTESLTDELDRTVDATLNADSKDTPELSGREKQLRQWAVQHNLDALLTEISAIRYTFIGFVGMLASMFLMVAGTYLAQMMQLSPDHTDAEALQTSLDMGNAMNNIILVIVVTMFGVMIARTIATRWGLEYDVGE